MGPKQPPWHPTVRYGEGGGQRVVHRHIALATVAEGRMRSVHGVLVTGSQKNIPCQPEAASIPLDSLELAPSLL